MTGAAAGGLIGTAIAVYRSVMKAVLVALLMLLLAIMGVQIVMRYALNDSLIWAEEVCRYILVWVSMLGVVFAYERGECAAVTLARDALPRRAALMVGLVGTLAGAVLCAVLVRMGLQMAERVGSQPIPALRFILVDGLGFPLSAVPPVYYVYVALPIGMALLGIRLLVDAFRLVGAFRNGRTAADVLSRDGAAP
ncbi:MAG: TRAP transporter small permease [Pseudomonadota bacterium]